METVLEQQTESSPTPEVIHVHDRDLVRELSQRLEAVTRYASCIANAEGDVEVQRTWRDLESQELRNITSLKQLIVDRIEKGEFLEGL
jgi:hypothetical protein